MAGFKLTPETQQDLRDIRQFTLNLWGSAQSRDYLSRLRLTLHHLAEMPEIGQSRDDELGSGVHSFPCVSHMIYYMPDDAGIVVLAILHQSRIPHRHLAERI